MKRIALAAAAALLGTGCIVSDSTDYGSVNVYWDFVRTAPAAPGGVIVYDDSDTGAPNGPCDESGVEVVEVESPVGPVTVDCVFAGVEGVGIDGIAEGVRPFRFRGWRGAFLVYDTTLNLEVRGNGIVDHFVDLRGVSAPLDLFAYLSYGAAPGTLYPTCADALWPDIGYEIKDVFGQVVDEGLVGCSDPFGMPVPVFAGDLELDNYDVRMRGYDVGGAVVFDSCDVPLDHFVAQVGVEGLAPVLRTLPVPACPP